MDHSMASVFASLAFHWAGRNNRYPDQLNDHIVPHCAQKLYYATAVFSLPDRQPLTLSPTTAVIDIGEYFDTKIAAFKAHISQAALVPLFEEHIRRRGKQERFHLAAAATSSEVLQETDLFAGVKERGTS
jgi:LmbE family N-acetylglucosaminyl deacetylase